MAERVTVTDVRNVVRLSTDMTDPIISGCIQTGNTITDSYLLDKDLDEGMLAQIELYLSAHFCSLREPQLYEEEWGGRDSIAKEKRAKPSVGKGFYATWYGQQAMIMDTSGTLAEMSQDNKKQAGLEVFGPYCETEETRANGS